jgi:hypothetical protein
LAKKVVVEDEKKLRKAVHRDNYIYIILLLACVVIDYDMFSESPRWVVLGGNTSAKVLIIAFQLVFVASLFFWGRKKKKIIAILLNGEKTKGKITDSVAIKPTSSAGIKIHVFTYKVDDKKYTVSSKDKYGSKGDKYTIIYETGNPKNSIIFEHLKSNVQELISY